VHDGDELALSVDADISMSEDPEITFGLKRHGSSPMRVDLTDSAKAEFHKEFAAGERS
jgi:hypothetical protein